MTDRLTWLERLDRLTFSDCETCRVWRVAVLIGWTASNGLTLAALAVIYHALGG